MLGEKSGIPKSEYTLEKLKERYYIEYVNNTSLWNSFPYYVKNNLLKTTGILNRKFDQTRESSYIFMSIRLIHIAKWLNETGYGDKLKSKLDRLVYKDEYGDYVFDDMHNEVVHFVKKRLNSIINAVDGSLGGYYIECAKELDRLNFILITWHENRNAQIKEASSLISSASDFFENDDSIAPNAGFDTEDPYEYEKLVAEKLCSLGWSAYATSGSGDQGADVIAEHRGIKLIIQCKLYNQPVGNKAVQEVASAERFFDGNFSAVVTNNEFTKSARRLAESLNVYLIHHSQLEELSNILLGDERPRAIYSKNTIDIARLISEELESLGWITSYDPEEPTDEKGEYQQTLAASKEEISVIIHCTAFDEVSVDKEYLEMSFDVFKSTGGFDFLVVTSSTGFTEGVFDFAYEKPIFLFYNSDISNLDKLLSEG